MKASLAALIVCSILLGRTAGGTGQGEPTTSTQPGKTGRMPAELRDRVHGAVGRALKYLEAVQEPNGGWVEQSGPAITALVATCFVDDARYGPEHPVVTHALRFVLKFRQPDGGIYDAAAPLRNYHTSVCLMLLSALPRAQAEAAEARDDAIRFLKRLQWDESEGKNRSDPWYGGAGYGPQKRPDLSNTQMMLEALHESGLPPSDPVFQKALVFIQRCQMLSHKNDQPFASGAQDGGFIYTPANGGESKAGTIMVAGRPVLRSYGSMTYAGFKSMLYANVDRDDARVRAALEWIRGHYSLDENPNMPNAQSQEGLFYYYHVFAKALEAWGEPVLIDAQGRPHHWRNELCEKLLSLQQSDGSWVNQADRWMEGIPQLVTSFAVLALQTALE
jgi:squalene-hopene/tetraprenyl-beta-curcumene cyclase